MGESEILNLLLVLLAAWGGGIFANKLGLPAILGELTMGIILGPALLGVLHDSHLISSLADVGILLLMVYIGMEIDIGDLKKASWPGFIAAAGSFIVPFILGYYSVILFKGTQIAALMTGLAVSVTSLATKSRILLDLKLLNTRIANILMAGALITDTLALIIFAGIVSIVEIGNIQVVQVLIVLGKALLFFGVTSLVGIYVFPLVGKLLERAGLSNRTFSFTLLLIITFAFAELAEVMGMHGILGAFIAGLFIRDGVFNRQLTREVNKVFYDISIGFLAPIFFIISGFYVDLNVFATDTWLMLTIIVLAIVGKIIGTMLFYLPTGYGWREGLTIGIGMNGRGAVQIVIAEIGLQMGIISKEIFSILVLMAIITTLIVPFFLTLATKWLRKRGELVEMDKRNGYILVGINPLSLMLARELKKAAPVTLIDSNEDVIKKARSEGFESIQGNALKEEILLQANAQHVKTIIAITRNSEINILAGQMAHDEFLVPEKLILLSPGKEGADINLLIPLGASTIFGMKTNLDFWNNLVLSNSYSLTEVNPGKGPANKWVKAFKKENKLALPLLITGNDGKKRPFHFNEEFYENERVVIMVQKTGLDT
jgi:Kef-type K+ transport system membrane component KefB